MGATIILGLDYAKFQPPLDANTISYYIIIYYC